MNLLRRNIGRRVAGVGVGVALLMLGLEGPAFAAAPTIASFTPTSGPGTAAAGCIVDVTGTAFTDSPAAATTIDFVAGTTVVPAPNFSINSATDLWVEAPALASGTSYNIKITNNGGTATSATTFLATTGAGACAPTVTTMTPDCGSSGTTVVIAGTNLLADVDPATTPTEVAFFPYGAGTVATHTIPNSDSPTSLSVLVPSAATTGPIRVTTFGAALGGQVFSDTAFKVPPPDCPPVGGNVHARSVSLRLRKALVARGKVSVGDGFTDCAASVPVRIQRRVSGHWKTVGRTTTTDTGAYKKRIRNRHGRYRALAPTVKLGEPVTDVCSRAVSRVVRH
jgi:hypothetical protein